MGWRDDDLVVPTEQGLYCAAGGFHIDPWKPVARAVITHAHSDHLVHGCESYLCSREGEAVTRLRLGKVESQAEQLPETPDEPRLESVEFGETRRVGDVLVSLHPAGHILGSAQVRIEHRGRVWVVSGDYRPGGNGGPRRVCTPMEPVRCEVFITESTFGLPIYRWDDEARLFDAVNAWWRESAARGSMCVVLGYALGKAQRVLAGLDESIGPIGAHGSVMRINDAYAASGVKLPRFVHASGDGLKELRRGGIVVGPPSAAGSGWMRRLAGKGQEVATAMASGWMMVRGSRRRRPVERGFAISDHADWGGLLSVIEATEAERVGVTHGSIEPLVRWLQKRGRDAFAVPTRYRGESEEREASGSDEEAAAEGAS